MKRLLLIAALFAVPVGAEAQMSCGYTAGGASCYGSGGSMSIQDTAGGYSYYGYDPNTQSTYSGSCMQTAGGYSCY
jgi:hypothetical protein